jgi:myo-inositol catabolism protein IolH
MKIALDPYMIRHLSLPALCRATAELGYDQIELSPRSDFLDWWVMPRASGRCGAGRRPSKCPLKWAAN